MSCCHRAYERMRYEILDEIFLFAYSRGFFCGFSIHTFECFGMTGKEQKVKGRVPPD